MPVKETFFSRINKNKTATSSIEYDRSMQVVLFIDTFTQNFEPQNATAAIAVLEQAGYKVHGYDIDEKKIESLKNRISDYR